MNLRGQKDGHSFMDAARGAPGSVRRRVPTRVVRRSQPGQQATKSRTAAPCEAAKVISYRVALRDNRQFLEVP